MTQNQQGIINGVVQIGLTAACQCDCRHCGVKTFSRNMQNKMNYAFLKRLFHELSILGVKYLDFSGGEPTIRKDLPAIVRLAKRCGFQVFLETNGILLTERLIRLLKSAGCDRLCLSVDHHLQSVHDRIRNYRGAYVAALKALEAAKRIGLETHVSLVPQDRNYFLSGEINTSIRFFLKQGAQKIRILFPSYVGNGSYQRRIFCSQTDEFQLLRYIHKDLSGYIYVESELSPLASLLKTRHIPCPAKSLFVYIACDGSVMPCPYVPIIFGNVAQEPFVEIYHRIRTHPLLKGEGIYCPTRNPSFLKQYIPAQNTQGVAKATMGNRIDLTAPCNNNCRDCSRGIRQKTTQQLRREIAEVDKQYADIELFGGDIFLRPDVFHLLDQAAKRFQIIIHSNGRIFACSDLAKRLSRYPIKAIKVMLFATASGAQDDYTRTPGSFIQAILGVQNLVKNNIPACITIPYSSRKNNVAFFKALGISSICRYQKALQPESAIAAVSCGGMKLKKIELLWLAPTIT